VWTTVWCGGQQGGFSLPSSMVDKVRHVGRRGGGGGGGRQSTGMFDTAGRDMTRIYTFSSQPLNHQIFFLIYKFTLSTKECVKEVLHEIFDFFHESVYPRPLSIPLNHFKFFSVLSRGRLPLKGFGHQINIV
jgi:hypothetical protein